MPFEPTERETNGHGPALDDTAELSADALPWPERKRSWLDKGWRVVTGRPARATADRDSARGRWPAPATIGLLFTAFMWLAGLTVGAVWWGGGIDNEVENHDTTLSTAGIAQLIATNEVHKQQIAEMREKFRKQEEYNDLVIIYENRVRELLVSLGVRQRDLPTMPKRPR